MLHYTTQGTYLLLLLEYFDIEKTFCRMFVHAHTRGVQGIARVEIGDCLGLDTHDRAGVGHLEKRQGQADTVGNAIFLYVE